MGIEIRPAAVAAMLDEKAWKLDKMKETFTQSVQAMYQFVYDDTLKGAAYDAAKERFACHIQTIEAFELWVDRSKQIDSSFKRIIERTWGGMAEVSETYWLDQRARCSSKITYFKDKAERAERSALDPTQVVDAIRGPYYRMQVSAYENAWNIANDFLNKIYQYCNETNNIYNDADLNALDTSIGQAISAFNNAKFNPETKTWAKMDTSCFDGMAKNVEKVQETYNLKLSETEDTVIFTEDLKYAYCKGKKYNLDNDDEFEEFDKVMRKEDFDWLETLANNSISGAWGTAWKYNIQAAVQDGALSVGRKSLLNAGILRPGTINIKDGYATFRGFKMADGAGKMLTRCKVSNLNKFATVRATQFFERCGKFSDGVGTKVGGCVISAALAIPNIKSAYDKEYERGFYLPEDRRRSNAEAAGIVSAGKSGVSIAAGAAAGAAVGTFICPGIGTVGGLVVGYVGGLIGSYGYDFIMSLDFDQNGKSLKSDYQDYYYNQKVTRDEEVNKLNIEYNESF